MRASKGDDVGKQGEARCGGPPEENQCGSPGECFQRDVWDRGGGNAHPGRLQDEQHEEYGPDQEDEGAGACPGIRPGFFHHHPTEVCEQEDEDHENESDSEEETDVEEVRDGMEQPPERRPNKCTDEHGEQEARQVREEQRGDDGVCASDAPKRPGSVEWSLLDGLCVRLHRTLSFTPPYHSSLP